MIHNLKPYPAYIDSGVPWLGKTPEGWGIRRLKSFARNINDPADEARYRQGLRLGMENVESWTGKIKSNIQDQPPFSGAGKAFDEGDVLFGKLRPYLAKVVKAKAPGVCVSEFLVLRTNNEAEPSYLEKLLRSPKFIHWISSQTHGAKMPRAEWDLVGQARLPAPPLTEQRAIVRFLDWADRRIRFVIAARKRRIQLLEEYRQALINDAVTGKFDVRTGKPYPSYKDSGVPWLGKVPEGWEVVRLKRIARLAYGGSLPANERQEREVPVYGSNGPVGYHNRANTLAPVIIVGRKGSFGKIQYSTKAVFAIDTTFFADKRYTNADLSWLFYALSQLKLDRFSQDSAVPGLDREEAYQRPTVLPSLPEQRAIAEYLDRETAKIDAAIGKTKESIALWEELRETLISEVVTGKLDVREVAETLPEEEPELEEKVKAFEGLLLNGENETSGADYEPELESAEETA